GGRARVFALSAMLRARRPPRHALARFAAGAALPVLLVAALSYSRSGRVSFGDNLTYNLDVARASMGSHVVFQKASPDAGRAAAAYLDDLRHAPVRFVAQRAAALWELWGPWPGGDEPRSPGAPPRSLLARGVIGLRFVLLLGALSALGVLPLSACVAYLWCPAIAVTAVHVAFFSMPRFTFAVEPFLIVLAACGVAARVERWCERGDSNPHSLSAARS